VGVPEVDRDLERAAYFVGRRRGPERLEQRLREMKDRLGQLSLR
jgi:hypothetical protein